MNENWVELERDNHICNIYIESGKKRERERERERD
jgi:hypothetical protein